LLQRPKVSWQIIPLIFSWDPNIYLIFFSYISNFAFALQNVKTCQPQSELDNRVLVQSSYKIQSQISFQHIHKWVPTVTLYFKIDNVTYTRLTITYTHLSDSTKFILNHRHPSCIRNRYDAYQLVYANTKRTGEYIESMLECLKPIIQCCHNKLMRSCCHSKTGLNCCCYASSSCCLQTDMRQRAAYLLLQNQIKNPNNWTKLMYLEYLSLKLKDKKIKHVSLSLRYYTNYKMTENLMERPQPYYKW
jgi:hypothetical protein